MMQKRKGLRVLLLVLNLIAFSWVNLGCWDVSEIDEEAFILGVAIDEGEKKDFKVTFQIAVPERGGEGGTLGKQENKTTESSTFQEAFSLIATRTNLIPTLGHLKLVLISEAVAREHVNDVLDYFVRNPDSRLEILVIVTKGKAQEVLAVESFAGMPTSLVIEETFTNSNYTDRLLPEINLRIINTKLHANQDILIPRVTPGDKEIKVAGSGVLKNGKLVGWLGERDTVYASWIMGYIDGGTVTPPAVVKGKGRLSFREMRGFRKISTDIVDGRPIGRVELQVEGSINEVMTRGFDQERFNEKNIRKIESNLENLIEENALQVIRKTQEEWQADVFGFGTNFKKYHPKAWVAMREDWNEIYSEMEVVVEVEVKVRRLGLRD